MKHLAEWHRTHPKKPSARSGTDHAAVQEEADESVEKSATSLDIEKDGMLTREELLKAQGYMHSISVQIILWEKLWNPRHGQILSKGKVGLTG